MWLATQDELENVGEIFIASLENGALDKNDNSITRLISFLQQQTGKYIIYLLLLKNCLSNTLKIPKKDLKHLFYISGISSNTFQNSLPKLQQTTSIPSNPAFPQRELSNLKIHATGNVTQIVSNNL